MTNDNQEFLRNAYHHVDFDSTFPVNGLNDQAYNAAQSFKISGLITEAHGGCRMQFAVPLMRGILGVKLFTEPISNQSHTQSAVTFDEFLLLTFERMRPSFVGKHLSRAGMMGPHLMKREWQDRWLKAARTAVPLRSVIMPVDGSPDYLDYYIAQRRWGVGISTEGMETAGRIAHCPRGGTFTPIDHLAIVDFRHHSAVPKELKPHFWYAMYPDDYKTITVRRQGHEDKVITLCGDWDLSPTPVVGDQS